jgi:2-polyprenyl-3-methyl-5-hydroxy-6-metoxy-1,4-benzoquinol methylase
VKIKIIPENLLEWIALRMNLAPLPLVDTQVAFNAARAIMTAAELGIYECIGKSSVDPDKIASTCNTNPKATKQLLDCLVGVGYLKWSDGKYSIKPKYHKWLLTESESNLIGKLRFQIYEWDWMANLESYVKTGKGIELHSMTDKKEWAAYQEGMRDLSVNLARELAGKISIPSEAKNLLDIGGSHGLFSIELCKKYKTLSSTILELQPAIEPASAIAKKYDTTGRVSYKAGNILQDDIGKEKFDVVMINNVVHHFTDEQNRMVAKKITASLKPGGIFLIGEFIRSEKPGEGGVVASTTGLYFSLTSYSGTWSESEMESWMNEGGLKIQKPIAPMNLPGWKMIIGKKII